MLQYLSKNRIWNVETYFRRSALATLIEADPKAATIKDDQGCNVLHWACYNGHSECVVYLLERNVIDTLEGKIYPSIIALLLSFIVIDSKL